MSVIIFDHSSPFVSTYTCDTKRDVLFISSDAVTLATGDNRFIGGRDACAYHEIGKKRRVCLDKITIRD